MKVENGGDSQDFLLDFLMEIRKDLVEYIRVPVPILSVNWACAKETFSSKVVWYQMNSFRLGMRDLSSHSHIPDTACTVPKCTRYEHIKTGIDFLTRS